MARAPASCMYQPCIHAREILTFGSQPPSPLAQVARLSKAFISDEPAAIHSHHGQAQIEEKGHSNGITIARADDLPDVRRQRADVPQAFSNVLDDGSDVRDVPQ